MGGPDRQTRVNHNAPSISQGNKKGKNFAPPGTNSFLDLTPLQREAKMKMAELLPLKVYNGTFNLKTTVFIRL